MNYHASALLATIVLGFGLSGCAKEPEPAATAETAETDATPTPGESIASEGGTTTYYGGNEEQTQPANN